MASLAASFKIGTTGASSLVKSAMTLQREVQTFQDDTARIAYENSGHTDEAYQTYVNYLQGRIKNLQTTGTITDLTKAQNMQQEIVTATHSNVSYQIQQENLQLMATGDAGTVSGYQGKMGVVADEIQRAIGVGDVTLADSLQNQYYSLSQSMQNAQATAATASATLAKAGQTANATYQGDIVASLKDGMQNLEAASKNQSLQEWNTTAKAWVQQNADALGALGVSVTGLTQPNYFDIVNAVQGAIYNHTVLQAQAMAPYDAPGSTAKLQEAQNLLDGTTKISTLGGSLTAQEIQQAAQDPAMFAYNASTGTYSKTAQIGYHYMNQGGTNVLVPTFSGIGTAAERNKVFFLSPQQTSVMTKLGLNFSMNSKGTTGDGVMVQATSNSPDWLKNILGGQNAETNMYTLPNGQLVFRAGSTDGTGGFSSFVLSGDGSGRYGVLEQTAAGAVINSGGDYGFNAGVASMLLQEAQVTQKTLQVQQAAATARLQAQAAAYTQKLKMASAAPVAPIHVAPAVPTPQLQAAASVPQLKTVNPQPANTSPQPATASPQTTVSGASLQGGGGMRGIPL